MFCIRCQHIGRQILVAFSGGSNISNGNGSGGISTSATVWKHYESLGIPRSSTQGDIKAAYYKLSMQYHPDKNQGSESAAQKFREITRAYEVLGNYRLRRLYDKGVIHTAGAEYAQRSDIVEDMPPAPEDTPETKFYKSRFTKSQVSDEAGKTPIYDFDEWSRAHYGKSFERRREAKVKWDRVQRETREGDLVAQNEVLLFGVMVALIGVYAFFSAETSYDTPKSRAERAATSEKQQRVVKE